MENRIIIALDLDETLVHVSSCQLERAEDFHFGSYYVYARPYLQEFIEQCNQLYSLAIWSSAGEDYVQTIVNRFISSLVKLNFIWTRPNYMTPDVLEWGNSKNLKRLIANGFEPLRTLIIDDNPDDSICEFGNILEVIPFRGAPDDVELLLLAAYLEKKKDSEDIRNMARTLWRDNI